MAAADTGQLAERTSVRTIAAPLGTFLRTETGGAVFLLAATLAALAWVNADAGSYDRVWTTELSIRVDGWRLAQELRGWINNGLMAFFFFVVGLEARREFDMGELRERRRIALPTIAALGGMVVPVLIYLAFNAGRPSQHGWGAAMSTDTAFALGVLALVGPRYRTRLRAFMLTVAVADDLVALLVIAVAYTDHLALVSLAIAFAFLAVILVMRSTGLRRGLPYAVVGAAAWVAVFKSGVDPVIVGLVMGLLTYAYPAMRIDLERATDLFRSFREQPTPELARTARQGVESAISPNERLAQLYHPWTSYVIVPLFALANAGIQINGSFLTSAFTSRITLGIVLAYVVGKPVGILAASWLATRRGIRLPIGWGALAGGAIVAGVGFTVSLLIATLAFDGTELEQAKLGILSAALIAATLAAIEYRVLLRLPPGLKIRAITGPAEAIVDLAVPVDPDHDRVRGPDDAPVTLVEYADFECPYCGQAEPAVRELLADFGDDLRYVFRHLPLSDVHPNAELAAEAAEAAAAQGAFWPMHDLLFQHQDALRLPDLLRYADQLGLDVDRFRDDLKRHVHAGRVAEDVESADLSSVSGTPTFFVNGLRHYGAYDLDTLASAVRTARARTLLASR
jgi:Na+/H+ antiporter NhaA